MRGVTVHLIPVLSQPHHVVAPLTSHGQALCHLLLIAQAPPTGCRWLPNLQFFAHLAPAACCAPRKALRLASGRSVVGCRRLFRARVNLQIYTKFYTIRRAACFCTRSLLSRASVPVRRCPAPEMAQLRTLSRAWCHVAPSRTLPRAALTPVSAGSKSS